MLELQDALGFKNLKRLIRIGNYDNLINKIIFIYSSVNMTSETHSFFDIKD